MYLHRNEDLNCVELDAASDNVDNVNDVPKDDKMNEEIEHGNVARNNDEDKTMEDRKVSNYSNENAEKVHDENINTAPHVAKALSTDEIIKMYKNVEFDVSKSTISTDDILKMYESDLKSPRFVPLGANLTKFGCQR